MNSKFLESNRQHYQAISERDEDWGIVVTTVGKQNVKPKSAYPPSEHPQSHFFRPHTGRVLSEYQLLYIVQGKGYFESKSCTLQKIEAGTIIFLFPGEWHNYYPDSEIGWKEYWVGFRGVYIDERVKNNFFSKTKSLYNVGINSTITNLYEDIIYHTAQEKIGCQQIISGIVLHILGVIYYKDRNNTFANNRIVDVINEARIIMKENSYNPLPIQLIAQKLGVGYTWFRRMFKNYTGISPAQYQMQQRLIVSKELLTTTDMNIVEIAYKLNFENGGQFTAFFKNKTGYTPSEFRKQIFK